MMIRQVFSVTLGETPLQEIKPLYLGSTDD